MTVYSCSDMLSSVYMYDRPAVLLILLRCARMRSRVMCSVASVCIIYIYVCMSTKNRLFSALPLENLLLSIICCLLEFKHLQCGLLRPTSYTDRAIHAFPNKMRRPPWPRNIFFRVLTAHHTLWARVASCSGQVTLCALTVLVLQ